MDRPDAKGREAILNVHVKGKPLEPNINLGTIAKGTPGFVGADIENLVNEAAILAARRNTRAIGIAEFQEAVERVIAGPERRSRLISDEEKQIVAYHEAGHALVMKMVPNADTVHKISIISRGMALGYTMPLPDEDHLLYSRDRFRDELAGLLGGRVAEEEVFGDITTGASNDLERVTSLARRMVTQYGMSEVLGPQTFGEKEELVFLGREIGEQRNYSEEVAESIDKEVRKLVSEAHDRARGIVRQYRAKLDEIARRLIENETLDAAEFQAMFAGIGAAA
jgi:cell division protease FtsH